MDFDFFFQAVISFFQRNFQIIADIRPAPSGILGRTGTAGGAAHKFAEDVFKNAAEASAAEIKVESAETAAETGAGALSKGRMAVTVVCGAFLAVFQDFISFRDFFEFYFRFFIAGIAVRVIFHCHRPVSLFDFHVGSVFVNPQKFIVILFSHVVINLISGIEKPFGGLICTPNGY